MPNNKELPNSHKNIPSVNSAEIFRFAIDELGILVEIIIDKGIDPAVVIDAFIEVAGTMDSRVKIKKLNKSYDEELSPDLRAS